MCVFKECKTEKPGKIYVYETIGDGSFAVSIFNDCADRLGVKEHDDLPELNIVRQRSAQMRGDWMRQPLSRRSTGIGSMAANDQS